MEIKDLLPFRVFQCCFNLTLLFFPISIWIFRIWIQINILILIDKNSVYLFGQDALLKSLHKYLSILDTLSRLEYVSIASITSLTIAIQNKFFSAYRMWNRVQIGQSTTTFTFLLLVTNELFGVKSTNTSLRWSNDVIWNSQNHEFDQKL